VAHVPHVLGARSTRYVLADVIRATFADSRVLDGLPLRPHGPDAAHPVRDQASLCSPLHAPAAGLRALTDAARLPRRRDGVPAMPVSHQQAVRVREEGGRQRAVLAGEGVVRHFVRQAPRLRLSQVHAAVSWRLVWPVCEYVRQAEEELVRFVVVSKRVQGADAESSLPELHPCTQPCHAPSSCPELEPCMATVTLTCPCGRIKQASPCGRSATNPLGRAGAAAANIKCSNECAIAKRNARLAEALGISADRQEGKSVNYADDLMTFARANQKFCLLAEKTFAE
jgi:hypothetical protein